MLPKEINNKTAKPGSVVDYDGRLDKFCYGQAKLLDGMDWPFYALIGAAMLKADTRNLANLRTAFPRVYEDLANFHK